MDVQGGELSITNDGQGNDDDVRGLPNIVEKNMALLFLKLESKFNVSNKCIDEIRVTLYLPNNIRSHHKRHFTVLTEGA